MPRYDRCRIRERGDHAVVIGGSVGGMLAARVLADAFDTVTVVEKDELPDGPVPRPGVPQSAQIHVLQEAGRSTIEDLLPGFCEDVISAGGLLIDSGSDIVFYNEGDYVADGPRRIADLSASRPLVEHVVREQVTDRPEVNLRSQCYFVQYLVDRDGTTVTGVTVRDRGSEPEELSADLVVDTTGKASRTPDWLERQGFPRPEIDEVEIGMGYSTVAIERPPDERGTYLAPAAPPHTRGGSAFPVEGDRWLVNLHGVHGDHPPAEYEGFEDYAASLPIPHLKRLLDTYPRLGEGVEYFPFPAYRRRHYDELDEFPEGLLVLGDAIANFNPVNAQGISVAALEALALHHTMASHDLADLADPFFERAAAIIDGAWTMAVVADFQFPQTTGPKPLGTDLFVWYQRRLTRKAHTDSELRDALFRVVRMEHPPTALVRPGVAWRVLKPSLPSVGRLFDRVEKFRSLGTPQEK